MPLFICSLVVVGIGGAIMIASVIYSFLHSKKEVTKRDIDAATVGVVGGIIGVIGLAMMVYSLLS